jgi:hypothetical protein
VGLRLDNFSVARVDHTTSTRNGGVGGIRVNSGSTAWLSENDFSDNFGAGMEAAALNGVPPITVHSSHDRFERNGDSGVVAVVGTVTLVEPRIDDNAEGVFVADADVSIEGGSTSANGDVGFVELGASMLVLDRTIVDDNAGDGILLLDVSRLDADRAELIGNAGYAIENETPVTQRASRTDFGTKDAAAIAAAIDDCADDPTLGCVELGR